MLEHIQNIVAFLLRGTTQKEDIRSKMQVLDSLSKLLTDRVTGVEYIILRLIKNVYLIKSSFNDFEKSISLEILEANVSNKIRELLFTKEFNMKESLENNDLILNPSDPKENIEIVNYFFTSVMESLEYSIATEVSSLEAILSLESLKELMITNRFKEKLMITSGLYATKDLDMAITKDKELQEGISEIQTISVGTDDNVSSNEFTITSYEDSVKVRTRNMSKISKPLFPIISDGPLSDKIIYSDELAVLVAEINVGKTRFVYDAIYRCLISGVNVTFVSTEENQNLVQSKLEKAHLFKMFKYRDYPEKAVMTRDSLEDEALKHQYDILEEKMELVRRDLWGNENYGNLHQVENFNYEDSRDFFRAEKRIFNSDIVFIDHIRVLKSNGRPINGRPLSTQKEQLAHLTQSARLSKVEDGLAFFLVTHPNSEAESSFKSNKQTLSANLTAAAREVSEGATRIFYLTSELHLEVKDFVYLTEAKAREEGKVRKPQILARQGASNIHLWLEQNQEEEISDDITSITD